MTEKDIYYNERLDFNGISDVREKTQLAISRLENPYCLSEEDAKMYRDFLSKQRSAAVKTFIDRGEVRIFPFLVKYKAIKKSNIASFVEYAQQARKLDVLSYLLNVSNEFRVHPRKASAKSGACLCREEQILPADDIKVGDIVWMCKNPMPWQVLEKKAGRALLISKFAVDCKQYNFRYENTSWGKCSLRRWLNGSFFDSRFTRQEKQHIMPVSIDEDDSLHLRSEGGDSVFLLSVEEAKKYFKDDDMRKARMTKKALDECLWTFFDEYGHWWLRSTTANNVGAAFVKAYGDVFDCGGTVVSNGFVRDFDNYGIRPAVYISTK